VAKKKKEYFKSQEMRTIPQKALPFRIKSRIDSETRSKVKIQNNLLEGVELDESDFEENILQDPQRRKLMIWLLPQWKTKNFSKKELIEMINIKKENELKRNNLSKEDSGRYDYNDSAGKSSISEILVLNIIFTYKMFL